MVSRTSSFSPRTNGRREVPCNQAGASIPATSQMLGNRSIWLANPSTTWPPLNPPGPRTISITPIPWSVRWHFIRGKASPWSVVHITSVLSASPFSSSASKTTPIFLSSVRAESMYSAISCRVTRVSGNGAGGLTYLGSVLGSPSGCGSNPFCRRCVSPNPTSKKKGASGFSAMNARARSSAPARVLPSDKIRW